MRRWLSYLIVLVLFLVCGLGTAAAQKEPRRGQVVVPPTNVVPPKYRGRRAHTNFLIFVPGARTSKKPSPQATSGPGGETPDSLSCIYQTWAGQISGCPITPSSGSSYNAPSGGSHVIAIVDAYDYPTAASDFQFFSQEFGLPSGNACGASGTAPCFTKVYATGSQPQSNCSWAQEEALDIEWAHAMAPKAQIILVEAASSSMNNLMQAVSVATTQVVNAGGGEVSMSWGGSETSTESTLDSYFNGKGVTYFASSGDTGGAVIWPSTSPDVISAGGTTINRNSSGDFTGETTWSDAGGGPSLYEPAPSYQSGIYTLAQMLNGFRGTPDISFDANPASGVSVYDSTPCQGYSGWEVFGGTSVASPSLSGIYNYAGDLQGGWDGGTNSNSTQSTLYQNYNTTSSGGTVCNYQTPFYDVTSGSAVGSFSAAGCWDFASGIGTVRGLTGLKAAAGYSLSSSSTSQSVTQGQSASYTVNVTYSGGFTGTVDLSASGLPTGASASFNPSSVTSSGSSTMTVTTSTSTPTGTYTLTITGTSGSTTEQTEVSLQVNAASSSGTFKLGASSLTITVPVNSSSSDTITVTPSNGFTGSVSLSLSGLPQRTNSSFSVNPVSITGSNSASSTLTISTHHNTSTGTYPLILTATSGSLTQTLDLTLVVGSTSSPDFSLSASPSGQTVSPGSPASYTVSVSASGGFTGSVGFSASGLPSGASASFNPSSVSGSGSSTMTVTTGTSTPTGTYTLTITGTSGSLTHTATVTLTVSTSSSGDNFSLSASPSSVFLHGGGGTATYSITVTPSGGFDQAVGFAVSGQPSGSTVLFSPTSVTGPGTTTLTVDVPSGTNGNYTLTITGTSGSIVNSVSVGLKVH